MTGLHYQLIRFKFNPNYVMQKKAILFPTKLSGMLKAEFIVYLWTYKTNSVISVGTTQRII